MLGGEITLELLLRSLAATLLLAAVGGVYPAWRASRLAPAEALRAEGGSTRPAPGWIPIPALRDTLRSRARGLLTLGGITLGVAVVVALVGLGEGFVQQYARLGTADDTDLVLRQADVADIAFSALDEEVGDWLADRPAVADVAGQIIGFTSVPASPYFLIFGVEPGSYITARYRIIEGQALRGGREVILGRQAARVMGLGVGDELSLLNERYTIAGVFETGVPLQDGAAVMSVAEAQQAMRRPGQVSLYHVRLRDRGQADEIMAAVQSRFPEVMASRAAEFFENTQDVEMLRGLVWGLGIIALLVGGVVMLNTMVMSVYERTREIGTLRALGWSRSAVLAKVAGEALAIGLSGGLLGLLLGLGLVELVRLVPAGRLLVGGAFTPALLAQALGLAAVLGVLGGLYPAWWASRLAPAEALRYE
jgi:ABC-type lipoprotein release transport system permease subunit